MIEYEEVVKNKRSYIIWGLDLVYPAFVSPNIWYWYWVSYLEYMQCWQIKNYAIGEKMENL